MELIYQARRLGLTAADLEDYTIGMISDYMYAAMDEKKETQYRKATQSDMDSF